MYSLLNKYGQLFALVISALIIFLHFITGSDLGIHAARLLLYATGLLMIGFIIYSIVRNPKGSLPLIIGIVGILLLFLIFRGMASGDITAAMRKYAVTAGQGKFVSGGIMLATIMFFGAIILAFISEIRGLFK